MKLWMWFVLLTIACWGAYVPTIRHGQFSFGDRPGPLRAFLFVGLAYFLVSVVVLAYAWIGRAESLKLTTAGVSLSTIAGVMGALGALGIVFAIKHGGHHIVVAPLVFAGAPIVNTLVSMTWDRPAKAPSLWFFAGILLAGVGAAMVLRFKPE